MKNNTMVFRKEMFNGVNNAYLQTTVANSWLKQLIKKKTKTVYTNIFLYVID